MLSPEQRVSRYLDNANSLRLLAGEIGSCDPVFAALLLDTAWRLVMKAKSITEGTDGLPEALRVV